MGVKLLSKLLKTQCYDETKQIHLSSLFGKKICIDVSIYLYRYKSQNTLIESFYLMCSLFKHYNITPIFIFDGKPPESKREELEKRKISCLPLRLSVDDVWFKGNYDQLIIKED